MLARAGIQGELVYGESDDTAAYVREKPVTPDTFSATILHALGIDPATRLSPDGFTLPASTSQPAHTHQGSTSLRSSRGP